MSAEKISQSTDTYDYEREQHWEKPQRHKQHLAEQAMKNNASLLEHFATLADEDNERVTRATE